MSILSIIIIATTKIQEKLFAFVSKKYKFQLTFLGSGGKKVYEQEKKLCKTKIQAI